MKKYLLLLSCLVFAVAGSVDAANEVALLPHVENNVALKAVKSTAYKTIVRDGFTAAGDGGAAVYTASTLACSLNAGLGDGGSQVKPNSGGGCFLLAEQPLYDARIWGKFATDITLHVNDTLGTDAVGANWCFDTGSAACKTVAQAVSRAKYLCARGANVLVSMDDNHEYAESVFWNGPLNCSGNNVPQPNIGSLWPSMLILDGNNTAKLIGDGNSCATIGISVFAVVGARRLDMSALKTNGAACQSIIFVQEGGMFNNFGGNTYSGAFVETFHCEQAGPGIQIWESFTVRGGGIDFENASEGCSFVQADGTGTFTNMGGASITASMATTTLTVTAVVGNLAPGQTITGAGVTPSQILPFGTAGTTGVGGNGTYAMSVSQTVAARAMIGTDFSLAVLIGQNAGNLQYNNATPFAGVVTGKQFQIDAASIVTYNTSVLPGSVLGVAKRGATWQGAPITTVDSFTGIGATGTATMPTTAPSPYGGLVALNVLGAGPAANGHFRLNHSYILEQTATLIGASNGSGTYGTMPAPQVFQCDNIGTDGKQFCYWSVAAPVVAGTTYGLSYSNPGN